MPSGIEIPLPLVRPWAPTPSTTAADRIKSLVAQQGRGYIDLALASFLDYSPDDRARLAMLLQPPGAERERHPRYRAGVDHTPPYELLEREKACKATRAVFLAVHSDLDRDGRTALWRPNSFDAIDAAVGKPVDESNAARLRAYGRLILHRLGCWPWAVVDDGKLPRGWNGESALDRFSQRGDLYADDLRAWVRPLVADQAADLKFAVALVAG